MSFCAPARGDAQWTCFTLEELELMIAAWNKTLPGKQNPIDVTSIRNRISSNPEKFKVALWSALRDVFYPFCGDNETCWLDSIDLGKQLKHISPSAYKLLNYFTLKPKGTKDKNGWLSTTEIDYVMQQYAVLHPDFKYIGCFPSDYYKLSPSKFPLDILEKYEKAAIVFNLDASHERGSHWIAVFFDRDPKTGKRIVEYFDPTGRKPNKNLSNFLEHPYFWTADVVISKKKHQRGNAECGIYCLFYILERINGRTMEQINNNRVSDEEMNKFRDVFFRPYSEKFVM